MNFIKLTNKKNKIVQKFLKKLIQWLTIFSLSFTLTVIWIPISLGQIPLFINSSSTQSSSRLPWDRHQAYACGRFWCSNVYIYDGNTEALLIILGIYLSIWLVGLNISILAGAGVFAVALAFLSRNLLEDMLNGIPILCSDRYGIGDVIDVGDVMAGLVEDINLFVTSLRNLDGQVIAIPKS